MKAFLSKMIVVILFINIICVLSSCADADAPVKMSENELDNTVSVGESIQDKEASSSDTGEIVKDDGKLQDIIGNGIEVEIELPKVDLFSRSSVKADFKEFSLEEILRGLSLGKPMEWSQNTESAEGDLIVRAENENGDQITINKNSFGFNTNRANELGAAYGIKTDVFEQQKNNELPFLSREKLKEQVSDIAMEFFPDLSVEQISIEAYTADVMEAAKEEMVRLFGEEGTGDSKSPFKETYSEEDEYYYFEVFFSLEEISVCSDNFVFLDDTNNIGASITGMIDKYGLESFYLNGAFENLSKEPIRKPLAFEEAYQELKDKYEFVYLTGKASIIKAECSWIMLADDSSNILKLEPVWIFVMEQEREGIHRKIKEETIIQIKNGEILL
ncbi:hypothetical protein [Qiania dongpingensis]|uniref:Lipoprotein n=1 Tax=Qiania dongpingensis TaxID=2763669 RepID=A0A7G9G7C0_9FIRM|nr:hypothetical protein [Qiania dongpingensis]QNM06702.1 hypothetical protein H9Q78_06200 [Qiania dongpingensis]